MKVADAEKCDGVRRITCVIERTIGIEDLRPLDIAYMTWGARQVDIHSPVVSLMRVQDLEATGRSADSLRGFAKEDAPS